MRAYVTADNGLNVRNAPSTNGKKIAGLTYGTAIEVDRVEKGKWSKLIRYADARYVYGDYLSLKAPSDIGVLPLSYSRVNLHASAGGYPPVQGSADTKVVTGNRVHAVLIPAYEPHLAGQTIREFRDCGVEQFIIRAVAPKFPKDGREWAILALDRVLPFVRAIGTKGVMIQLHNEPNLVAEGWTTGWNTPTEYNRWFLRARQVFVDAILDAKIGFSPLSPGVSVPNVRYDERAFLQGCTAAIKASDWFAVHCYYGANDASDLVIPVSFWRSFAQGKPIVCTEAGPSMWKSVTREGALNMFRAFAKVRVPAFAWILNATGVSAFRGQAWGENGIILQVFSF